jgi:hypothetical protein
LDEERQHRLEIAAARAAAAAEAEAAAAASQGTIDSVKQVKTKTPRVSRNLLDETPVVAPIETATPAASSKDHGKKDGAKREVKKEKTDRGAKKKQ